MPIRWLYDQAHGQNNDDLLHQPLIQSHSLYSMETEKQLDPANEYYSPEPSDDEVEHDKKKSSQKELVDREVKDVFEDDDDEEDEGEEEEDDDDRDRSEDNKDRQEDHYLLDEEMNDNEDSYSEEEPVLTVTLEELSSPSIAIADSDMRTPPASTSTTSTTTTTTTVVERDGNVETHVTTIIEEEVDTSHTIINENSSGNHDTDEDKTSSVVSISMADMQVTSIDGDSHHNGSTFNSSDSSSEMVNIVNEHDHEHKEESFTSVVQETEETAEITTTADTIMQLEEESPVTTTLVTTESLVVDESTVNTAVRSGRKPLTITTATSSLVVDESITNDTEDNDNSSSSATLPAMPRSPRIHPRSLASVMPPLPPSSLSGEDSFDLNDTSALSSSSPPPPPPIVVDSADQQIAISMSLPKSPHIQPHVLSTKNWSDSEIVEEEEEIKEQTMVVVEEHEQEPSVIHEEHYMSTSSPPNVSSTTTTQDHLLPRSPRIRPITAHTSTLGDTKDESYHEDVDDDELSLDGNSMMLPPSPLMEPSMFQYPVDTTLVSAPYAMTTATTTTTSNMLITEQPGTVSMSIQSNHVLSNEHHLSDAPSSPLPSIVTRSPALVPMDQSSYISSVSSGSSSIYYNVFYLTDESINRHQSMMHQHILLVLCKRK
ncbi:hypothetical protein BDF22DRAFT_232246 [Syncephalis plumigaleata]|nr:hypothetical protein BDF22DRAFT_232246 [Syncephalis plumigaleata]